MITLDERGARGPETSFVSGKPWNRKRPSKLVVACSDGRLQENLDDFLDHHLGIKHYDRLYAPGGPGALATSGVEFLRSDVFRRECDFLVMAHAVEDVYLIFHGPSPDGPDEAVCADYRRIFPRHTAKQVRDEQDKDLTEVLRAGSGWQRAVRIHAYRCEVMEDGGIQFVCLRSPVRSEE
jgi:hypothetical protein